jgi:hypothetical protein
MSSVKVAVRIRPFNGRERNMNAKLNIRSEGGKVWIMNPVSLPPPPLTTRFAHRRTKKKKNSLSTTLIGRMTVMWSLKQQTAT